MENLVHSLKALDMATNSRLLGLPTELRFMIYDFVQPTQMHFPLLHPDNGSILYFSKTVRAEYLQQLQRCKPSSLHIHLDSHETKDAVLEWIPHALSSDNLMSIEIEYWGWQRRKDGTRRAYHKCSYMEDRRDPANRYSRETSINDGEMIKHTSTSYGSSHVLTHFAPAKARRIILEKVKWTVFASVEDIEALKNSTFRKRQRLLGGDVRMDRV